MLNELLKNRYSPRAFSSKAIEEEKVKSLFDAAKWAPSSMNEQPWRFIIARKDDVIKHSQLVNILKEQNQTWAKNAPLLVLVVAKLTHELNGRENHYALYDSASAAAHLTFQAAHLGLYIRQMGGFDKAKAKEVYQIPDGYEPVTVLAIGYKGNLEEFPEDIQKFEKSVRIRKELDEILFEGKFGEPSEVASENLNYNEV